MPVTGSIVLGILLLALGVICGGYATLIVERDNADKARKEGYEAGLKAGKKGSGKSDPSAIKKAEKKGYERGHADATAEANETIDERMSMQAEALIAQGYEAGLEANLCEAELVLSAGKVKG